MEVTAKQAAQFLAKRDGITILCHRRPDGDTLGSAFALYHALTGLGKRARVCCADGYPPLYHFLLGDYRHPQEFSEETVVAVDVASPALLGGLEEEYRGRVDLTVDHHQSNQRFASLNWVEGQASSTAEMIFALLGEWGIVPQPPVDACLYTGLITDTGCFRFSNTTPRALRAAAELLEGGLDPQPIVAAMFETKSRQRVAFESLVLSQMRYYWEGRCAVISTNDALQAEYGLDDYQLEGLSALPRQIQGVLVGVTIREHQGECRVSLRTNPPADASAICQAFGGGGHLRAAGCTILGNAAQAENQLVAEIGRRLG